MWNFKFQTDFLNSKDGKKKINVHTSMSWQGKGTCAMRKYISHLSPVSNMKQLQHPKCLETETDEYKINRPMIYRNLSSKKLKS